MSIPSQLPQLVTAARTGALQALALQAGQLIDARIVGAAPNGGTRVEIRGQMLNLLLPMVVQAGQTLTFEVQGSGTQLRLALQPAAAVTPSPAPATASPPVPQPASPLPMSPASAPPQIVPSPQPVPLAAQPTSPAAAQPGQPAVLPATPYAPASPAMVSTNPAATAVATTAPATPPAAQPIPGGIQPVAPAMTGGGLFNQPPPAQPATPQAALAQMVQASVPRQGAVTNLTAALTAIAGRVVLPEPVLRAAQQVLAGRVAIDGVKFDGASLQNAVRSSGVFQEAALARGQAPLPQADMKSALLALRQTLTTWLGQQAPVTPVAHIAPPLKGSVPRARANEPPPLDPEDGPEAIGKQLLERTDSALARVRLHQHASLPEPLGRTGDWSMDLPVLVGPQQTLMQIQIHRDQNNEGAEGGERGWQLRFALNLPGMGEVGAQVSLRAGATGVMLWATEPQTSAALEADLALLRDGLMAAGLNPSAVIVRHGAPPAPPPAPSGHFVDSRT
ncbi:flagellar hook-length control protein FliK [Devosia sp. A449]